MRDNQTNRTEYRIKTAPIPGVEVLGIGFGPNISLETKLFLTIH
jgi:hypothetical protein